MNTILTSLFLLDGSQLPALLAAAAPTLTISDTQQNGNTFSIIADRHLTTEEKAALPAQVTVTDA